MLETAARGLLSQLAVSSERELCFGSAPRPLKCGFGLEIGAGLVFPEVNFTLPAITIDSESWREVVSHYEQMSAAIIRRAVALRAPGLVLEFELLPAMTDTPEWGAEITALLVSRLKTAWNDHGLRSALRATPTDLRDQEKPPQLRTGAAWEKLKRSFELCIAAGGHIMSIESVGGKEVHDRALMFGELPGIVFALGVLAPRDMRWLWGNIVSMCADGNSIPGGDTACGFANTAMQLAHQKMLPEVLAAVVRAMCAPRSLAAYESGAVGPSKDCAYEGPIMKAIAGVPISMEGKSASCAHFSPLGNIAAAMCDLWSNESVQNVRLLSGSAPEAFTELLVYDCRLMNRAKQDGEEIRLRNWLVESDESLSPQAALLSPVATIAIARAIASEQNDYRRTVAAGMTAVEILRRHLSGGRLTLSKKESDWLARIEKQLSALPADEDEFFAQTAPQYRELYDPASYGLAV